MLVRVERKDRVPTVIQSRLEVSNAVDPEHADALHDAFMDADEATGVAVLWGEGGAFCAGADLKCLSASRITTTENASTHNSLDYPKDGDPVPRGPTGLSRLSLSKPVITAIEGPAVARDATRALGRLPHYGRGRLYGLL